MRILQNDGFTLVEVLVALLLLSLVTVAIVQIFNSSLRGIIFCGDKTKAAYELQGSVEMGTHPRDLKPHSIVFSFPEANFEVIGQKVPEKRLILPHEDRSVSVTVFVPEKTKWGDELDTRKN